MKNFFKKYKYVLLLTTSIIITILGSSYIYLKIEIKNRALLMSLCEFLYYIGGIVIAISALLALKQIKIAQDDISIRSQREAVTASANQCDRFAKEIIPLIKEIYKVFDVNKIKRFKPNSTNFKMDKHSLVWLQNWSEILIKVKLLEKIFDLLNVLESFSIYHTHGVCDEKVSYHPISDSFINIVNDFYPIIVLARQEDNKALDSIVQLYKIWEERSEIQKFKNVYSKKSKSMKKMLEQVASMNEESLYPIGTKRK